MELMGRAVALWIAFLLSSSGSLIAYSQAPSPEKSWPAPVMDQVIHDLCGKSVVLLGEPPVHGFGKVLDFKAELTRRLINECHFNGFFIESGIYDFLNIQKVHRSGIRVREEMVRAAIGGIWANQEMERLVPDLTQGAESGTLTLGGLDDQLSRGTYAQREMTGNLVRYISGDNKEHYTCSSALERHTLWQYGSDSPYSPADKARLIDCLEKIESAAAKVHSYDAARDHVMAVVLKRLIARDFPKPPANGISQDMQDANARDSSMYENFKWLKSRMPAPCKIIVWTATIHAAKDLGQVPGDEKRVSMGSFIHRDFGSRAFALAFSEYSGSYAFGSRPAQLLARAPDNSLEARAFAENGLAVRYFDLDTLQRVGLVAARPLGIDFKVTEWDKVFDGLVVFREEHPPTVTR
jgi:erythromycin esterase-like protein